MYAVHQLSGKKILGFYREVYCGKRSYYLYIVDVAAIGRDAENVIRRKMTVQSILRRLLQGPTIRLLYIYRISRDEFRKKNFSNGKIDCNRMDVDDLQKIELIQDNKSMEAFRKMYQKEICIVADYEGVPCGHAAMGLYPDFYFLKEKIEEEGAYIHYCFVNQKYRGKAVYPSMLTYLLQYGFHQKQVKRIYICTDQHNLSSQNGISKAGFKKWSHCYEIGWGGIIFFRIYREISNK